MLLCATMVAVSSCENENTTNQSEMVDVSFGVKFVESGSMTRGASEEYAEFYDKHIKTKELIPTDYNLTIYDLNGTQISTLQGSWDLTTFRLPIGKYRISGRSYGNYSKAELIFDEEIEIKSSGDIQLTAQYGCFLLMFPSKNCETYGYRTNSKDSYNDITKIDNLYYMFVKSSYYLSIRCTADSNTIYTDIHELDVDFKYGHYYYFDIMSGSFDIPMMENGGVF